MVAAMAGQPDIQRLIGDLAREGTVVSVDLDAGTARVQFADDLTTGDIPWLCGRAGKTRIYSPPSEGEQVSVLCPEADTARGVIIGSLSSDAHPHAAKDGSTRIDFEDGSWFGYDPGSGDLTAVVLGKISLTAPGGFRLVGRVEIEGDVDLKGKLEASADVVGAGESLKTHTHTGVQAGGGFSGPPR